MVHIWCHLMVIVGHIQARNKIFKGNHLNFKQEI